MARAVLLVLTLGAAGCSLLVDTSPYVGSGDAGPDARVDAAVDPNAPSSPEVRIDPATPVTTDELGAVIVTESTDPLAAGPVTYEYRWLRDGADSGENAPTVAAALTARGQTWRVEVTPVSADGGRRGAAGTAEVTIGNVPPSIGYLGLDHYRPIEGEVLQAFVGGVEDLDGDATRVSYRWTIDDVELTSVTGPRLTLDSAMFPPGAAIRVEATPDDMTDAGGSLSAGPAIVLSDTTRWRQLLPNRTFRQGDAVVYDPVGRRVILFDTIGPGIPLQVWEYALDDAGGQFIQIYPTGTPPPLSFSSRVYDDRNRRFLFFGGLDLEARSFTNLVYALDLSVRGSERWEVVATSGMMPAPRGLAAMAYDGANARVIMFGGMGDLVGLTLGDVWSLDVSMTGFETWTPYADAPTPGGSVGSSLIVDESRGRALLIGGASLSGGIAAAFDSIHTIPLGDLSAGFTDSGMRLPQGVYLATTGHDPAGDRAIVAFGLTDATTTSDGVYAVDLETLATSTVDLGPSGPVEGGNGFLVTDRYAERLIFFPGVPAQDKSSVFAIYSLLGSAVAPVHRYGIDEPPAVAGAVSSPNNYNYFGGESTDGVTAEVWSFDDRRNLFTRMTAAADELTGRSPGARASAGWSSGEASATLTFFGGSDGVGLADSAVWSLERRTSDTMQWIERTLSPASPAPPASRSEAMHFTTRCAQAGFFGGNADSGPSDETGRLRCTGAGGLRDCSWEDPVGAGTRPPGRFGGGTAAFPEDGRVALFGGASPSVLADLWILDTCASPQEWAAETATGTAPSPRSHHSMNVETDATDVTILLFGGRTGVDGLDLDDAFELVEVSAGSYDWRPVVVASGPNDAHVFGRHAHVSFYSALPTNHRLIVYGGRHAGSFMSDLWELRFRP